MDTTWITIVSFIITLTAFPTLVGIFWKEIFQNRKEKSAEAKKKRREELQASVREVIQEELKPVDESIKRLDKKVELVADGTVSSLRNDIKDCFYKCSEKGFRSDYDYKNIHSLYASYKNLGGNSFIDDIIHRFDALPPHDEFIKHTKDNHTIQHEDNIYLKNIKNEGGASVCGR